MELNNDIIKNLKIKVQEELFNNILSFWIDHAIDNEHGSALIITAEPVWRL